MAMVRSIPRVPQTCWPASELYARPALPAMAQRMGPTVSRCSWSFSAMQTADMVPCKAAEDFPSLTSAPGAVQGHLRAIVPRTEALHSRRL